jgi:hypothetical protein
VLEEIKLHRGLFTDLQAQNVADSDHDLNEEV